jgi:hypothetical protein
LRRLFSIVFALALVVGLGLVTASPVVAAGTIQVPGDYSTIQQAIDAARSGDTIMVAAGEYDGFVAQGKANISIIGTELEGGAWAGYGHPGATAIVTTAKFIEDLPVVGNAWVMAAVYDSQNINIKGIDFDGSGVGAAQVAVGIAYVDSTGRIADLTVENVIATELGAGVAIIGHAGTSAVEMTGATISSNDNVGIYVCGGSTLEAHFNNIVDNVECGLLSDGGGTVDATYNWWGHARGPLHLTNPLGGGNAVVGEVDFKPWLEAQVVAMAAENEIVNAIQEADTEVVVDGKATVTIAKYASNPHPSSSVYRDTAALDVVALSDEFEELGIFRDVRVTDAEPETEIEVRLYYTSNKARGFNETSLRPFWYDGTAWKHCWPDTASGVNTTDVTIDNTKYSGYMWARIEETDTTPTLADLNGTPWGGYGHPSPTPQPLCFVASAAYGTDTAKEIGILREFRDTVLLPDSLGAEFVSLYYEISPPVANFISQHEVLRTAVRVAFIDPIIAVLAWSHDLWP